VFPFARLASCTVRLRECDPLGCSTAARVDVACVVAPEVEGPAQALSHTLRGGEPAAASSLEDTSRNWGFTWRARLRQKPPLPRICTREGRMGHVGGHAGLCAAHTWEWAAGKVGGECTRGMHHEFAGEHSWQCNESQEGDADEGGTAVCNRQMD
jgi:hypothetical protein